MSASTTSVVAYLTLTNVGTAFWLGEVSAEPSIIGRSSRCQIRIPDQYHYVSRQHAKVWANRKGLWICDLGSKASTALNGILIEPNVSYRLAVGDRIWLGGLELDVRDPKFFDANEPEDRENPQSCPTGNFFMPPTTEIPHLLAIKQLSHAELEIILWLRRGLTTLEELAVQLHRSPNTIRTQMASIFKKIGVHSRHELLAKLQRSQTPSN